MKYEQIKALKGDAFRRLTGVLPATFELMVSKIAEADSKKYVRGGRPNKLSVEERILMTLEYLREYRTYFHIAKSYGVSESSCFNTIRYVENTLIRCPEFALPGRKALLKSDVVFETILIDATETPIERPKKNSAISIRGRKSDTP